MGQIDTTSFARFLSNGLQTGISMGENADRLRLQRDHLAQQQEQDSILNEIRRQQIAEAASERAAQWREKQKRRSADDAIGKVLLGSDDAGFAAALPSLQTMMGDASPDMQKAVYEKKSFVDDFNRTQARYDSLATQGATKIMGLDEFEKLTAKGYKINPKLLRPSAIEEKDAKDREVKESLIVEAMARGDIGESEMGPLMNLVRPEDVEASLTRIRQAKIVEQKALADQQAAAQKQQQAQTHQAHIGQLIQKKRAGVALTPQEEGMLVTTPGVSEYETKQPQAMSPFAFADDQTKLLDTEIGRIEQELLNQGVATKDKGAFLLNKDKVNEGDGKHTFRPNTAPTSEYTRRQELLAQRDKLLKHREALGMAQIQKSIGPVIQQLTAQLGRKPTSAEVRAALGAPPSSQSMQGQTQP